MRVIAGALGGRRLKAPPGRSTRPTSDRVREALFSMLGALDGAVVLDLFAGTGALGIEALSRGAERTVFVEHDDAVARVLGENLSSLGLGREVAELRRLDVRSALQSARAAQETYDLLFIDPPYRQASEWGSALAGTLEPLLAGGARVVAESDRRAPLELGMAVERHRTYGDTTITIHLHDDPT